MFGFLSRRKRPEADSAPEPHVGQPLDSARLVELMHCFPIGGKIRYFPEFRKEVILDSIVIAYGINNHMVYTQNDIHIVEDHDTPVFVLDDNWKDRTVRQIRRFCFIIPDIGNLENELDYTSRVELTNGGQLQRGTSLTLMSMFNNRGVPHVNTFVRKRVTLQEGYYANHAVIVLEALPETLSHIDQRQQYRVKTRIPVSIQLSEDGEHYACLLVDFSEYSVKLRIDEGGPPAVLLQERRNLILTIDLPGQEKRFALLGKILRKGENFIVVSLTGKFDGKGFRNLELLDALDIKATLLQNPETHS